MADIVLVPLDGTDKDARALAVAVALAGVADAGLHLVHVLTARDRSLTELPERRLADAAGRLAADAPQPVTWEVVPGADAADALARLAADIDARLVVMATRAARPADRALVGSVADRVMRESPAPVVLVPPAAAYLQGRQLRFTRVLVPLDGSTLATHALDVLLGLPGARTLEYVLLEVVSSAGDVAAAQARLAAAAADARARGATRVETVVLEAGDPAAAIIALLRDALIDVVAMSTRGRSGLRRLVLGSVAEAVIRASEVPVLLVTPAWLGRRRPSTVVDDQASAPLGARS
jgi:nucleotide-binding universal stress UspA family protein